MRVFLLAFFCLNQCIWAQSKAQPSAQTLVFTNVNVVDTRDGRILPDMTVVVRSGRIQGVASAAGQRSIERLTGILLACSSKEDMLRRQGSLALANQDVSPHASVATLAMATYDPEKAWNLFVQLSNNNTWQVPALVWSQTIARLGDTSLTADPRLKYVPISVRRQWELEKLRLRTSPEVLELAKKQSARARIGQYHAARRGTVHGWERQP